MALKHKKLFIEELIDAIRNVEGSSLFCKMGIELLSRLSRRQVSRTMKRSFWHLQSELKSGPQGHIMSLFSRNINLMAWFREMRAKKAEIAGSLLLENARALFDKLKVNSATARFRGSRKGIMWSLSKYKTTQLTQQVPTTGSKKIFVDTRGIWTSK